MVSFDFVEASLITVIEILSTTHIISLPPSLSLSSSIYYLPPLPCRHLQNFVLLFASNVENLLAHMLHTILPEHIVKIMENLLAIVYLYLVIQNFIWFVKPLKDRDDFPHLKLWMEARLDAWKEPWWWKKGGVDNSSLEESSGILFDQVPISSSRRGTVRAKNSSRTLTSSSQFKND
jgi:hypothetical protein